MTWSTLKRLTPLKSKGTGLRRTPFKKKEAALHPKKDTEGDVKATKGHKKAKRREKVDNAKRLDIVFSQYIRLRDAMDGGRTVCISCGEIFPFEQMQCGHFFSRRSLATRWHEDNCHSQCAECNCSKCGNLTMYKINLLSKIGAECFEELEALHNQERKWSDDELKELIAHYTKEARRLAKEKGINIKI